MLPVLNRSISEKDFRDFYWLKHELIQFCRTYGLSAVGGKQEVADRIALFLRTGKKQKPVTKIIKKSSKVQALSLQTVVTDSFRCTREVRNFFITHLGPQFKFSVVLQKYIKKNFGITFADIIAEHKRLKQLKKEGKLNLEIAEQFEYNRFTRAFFADPANAGKSRADCIAAWKAIKSKRGSTVYQKNK